MSDEAGQAYWNAAVSTLLISHSVQKSQTKPLEDSPAEHSPWHHPLHFLHWILSCNTLLIIFTTHNACNITILYFIGFFWLLATLCKGNSLCLWLLATLCKGNSLCLCFPWPWCTFAFRFSSSALVLLADPLFSHFFSFLFFTASCLFFHFSFSAQNFLLVLTVSA